MTIPPPLDPTRRPGGARPAVDGARRARDGAKRELADARRRLELAGTGAERLSWRGAVATRAALLAQTEFRLRELERRTRDR